ncbi:MAG: hypothetical protein ICV83_01920 [Cytophagales bacterium]|nr:hypothetical protein [Cytophagales bacterium]
MINHDEMEQKCPNTEVLTNAQLDELIRKANGKFKKLPNIQKLGVADVQKSFANLRDSVQRSRIAYANGFFIEMISLMLQHIDFHLRMFWVQKNERGKNFNSTDKKFFGVIINECVDLGFNTVLADKVKNFNDDRVKAIHKYALGEVIYTDLKPICEQYKNLDIDVQNYVHNEIGIPIYSIEDLGTPGDILLGPF